MAKKAFITEYIESIGKRVDICSDIFVQLEKDKNPGSLLMQMAKDADDIWFNQAQKTNSASSDLSDFLKSLLDPKEEKSQIDSNESHHDIEMKYLISRHRRLAQGLIDLCVGKGYKEKEYYTQLWTLLSQTMNSALREEKGACLYAVLFDKRTPYFQVAPGLQMPDKDYKNELEKLSNEISKVHFVLALNNKQKTETASQLLDIIDGVDAKSSKAVLLSKIISIIKSSKRGEENDDD